MKSLPVRNRARHVRRHSVVIASITAAAALTGCGPIAGLGGHGHHHNPGPTLAAVGGTTSASASPGTTSPTPGTTATPPGASPTVAGPGSASGSPDHGTPSPTPDPGTTSPGPAATSPEASPTLASPGGTSPGTTSPGTTSPGTTSAAPAPGTTSAAPAPSTSSATAPSVAPVSPTPTAPASTPAPAQSASPGATVCVQTTNAQCDFPAGASIVGVSSVPYVNQNIWAGSATYKQTLYATSPESWYVVANANTHFGGVLTFPNTGWDMSGAVDSYSSVTSSYSTTIPVNAQTAGWAAYDLWLNNWADEVMIQTDITANSYYDCTAKTSATFDGEPWHMCVFGSERVWKPGTDDQHLQNRTSGTINIQEFLTWMEQNGYLPAQSTWTAGSYGFEICDTGGASETFQLNSFTWSAQASGG